jgi:hypothetical protein
MSVGEYSEVDRDLALAARRSAEIEFRGKEIVLLEADALEDLRKTHARYFGKKALGTLATTASGGEVVISQASDLEIKHFDPTIE